MGLNVKERFFIPRQIIRLLWPQLLYIVLIPAFFVGFCLYYNPFDIKRYFSSDEFGYEFHIVLLGCIILVNLLIFRLMFLIIQKYFNINARQYIFWCIVETFAAACFMALYTTLVHGNGIGYLKALFFSLQASYMVVVYPYAILIMAQYIARQEEEKSEIPEDDALVKFYDERHKLKLTIAPSSILFITAEFNYIKINYMDSGRVNVFMLRNSMKSISEKAASYGIVRCQRSYFVNPRHVRVLRRDKEGAISAELDIDGIQPVPVSKQYYDALAELL